MTHYVLACGHPQYGETGYCSSISCQQYYGKHTDDPKPAVAKLSPVDPIGYAFQSELRNFKQAYGLDDIDDEKYDNALEAAINLIVMAGFDPDDSDAYGSPMEDHVQTLLTMALLRCPQLADRINGYDSDVRITTEYSG